MPARNTADGYGWVSRLLHWVMAVAIIGMLGLGTYISRMEPSFANLWLFGLHKSIGISLLAAAALRVVWHRISPPPAPLTDGIPRWQQRAALLVHRSMYLLFFAVPLAGWAASAATGIDVVIFGRITLPAIVPPSEALDHLFFAAHALFTKLLAGLVLLHLTAALHRHVIHRDRSLRRMIFGDSETVQ